jgi:hypothetical protein
MPHFGQSPGWSDSTPGHIGQQYFVFGAGFADFGIWNLEFGFSRNFCRQCSEQK